MNMGGNITRTDPEFNFTLDSGIGNNSSIGIVIYLEDVITIEKDPEKE